MRPEGGGVKAERLLLLFIHRHDFIGELFLGVGAIRQLVQKLHVIEALGDAVCRQTGLWVMVPALLDGGTHDLDALQGGTTNSNGQSLI